uniref:Uncharacterized protein n=1 Tax=Pseudonaja textilis TaxID=8673 RepID=A0A670ZF02_PSETE
MCTEDGVGFCCMGINNTFFLQLKVIAVDGRLRVIYEDSINFDKDLPEFGLGQHDTALKMTSIWGN